MPFSRDLLLLLLASGKFCAGLAIPRAGASSPGQYDLPNTWTPFGFTAPISVGDPPQEFDILVDWTWISTYVWTGTCYHQENSPQECLHPDQEYFNQSASRTFRYVPELYPSRTWDPNHFFLEDPAFVNYATDFFNVGPDSTEVVLQTSDFTFNLTDFAYPFVGIYGTSPVFKGDNASYQSTFWQSYEKQAWEAPVMAWHYCYPDSPDVSKATCDGHDAIQTHGGINTTLVDEEQIRWYKNEVFPDVNNIDFIYDPPVLNYWAIEVEGVKIGSEQQVVTATPENSGPAAIFDHAGYGRGMPLSPDNYDHLIAVSNATLVDLEDPPNNGEQDFYEVDCDSIDSLPTVSYTFTGDEKEWVIEPRNYVEKVDGSICVLNVRTVGTGNQFIGNFGETFAKDKYIIFDWEKLLVGIADIQWEQLVG